MPPNVSKHALRLLACLLACSTASATEEGASEAPAAELFVAFYTLSYHAHDTRAPGHSWNNYHPTLGAEYRHPGVPLVDAGDRWQSRLAIGVMEDSRHFRGLYAGAAVEYEWHRDAAWQWHAGLGAYTFDRSTSWSGRRHVSGALAPNVSLTHLPSGLGVNLLITPRIASVRESDTAGVLALQFVWRPPL